MTHILLPPSTTQKSGICLPKVCSEEVLQSQVGNMEFVSFLAMLGASLCVYVCI